MAENTQTGDRYDVVIGASTGEYNRSIDAAINKTLMFRKRQEELTASLVRNQEEQERVAAKIEKTTQKYGENSQEVQNLLRRQKELENSYRAMTGQLNSLNRELDAHQKELAKADTQHGKAAKSTATFMSVIKAAVTGYVGKSFLEATIGGAAQFEQYEASFAVLLGDLQSAKSMMAQLQDFAAKTPFQLPDVTEAAQLLMNYGVEADSLIETMTHLGDLSQGQAEKLDRVSLAYGQMLAKGKVTGEELRQMTEAGVPLTQALADSLGTTTAELSKMIEKGQVGIPQLNTAIESLTTGTGKFAGMMEKQSQTLLGQWSTFKDEVGQTAREIGEGAAGELKTGLSEVRKELDKMRQNGELTEMGKNIGAVMSTTVKVLSFATKAILDNKEAVIALMLAYGSYKTIELAAAGINNFKRAQNAATVAQAAFNKVASLNPYGLLAGILATVVTVIYSLATASNETKERVKELHQELENFETTSIEGASSQLGELRVAAEQTVPRIQNLGKISNKTAGEKQLLKQYIEELNTTLGYEAAAFDEVNNQLIMNTGEVYKNIEALQQKAKVEAVAGKMKSKYSEMVDVELEIAKYNQQKAELESEIAELDKQLAGNISSTMEASLQRNRLDLVMELSGVEQDIAHQKELLEPLTEYVDKLSDLQRDMSMAAGSATESVTGFWSSVASGSSAMGATISDLNTMASRIESVRAAQDEFNSSGALSAGTLHELVKIYPELAEKAEEYSLGLAGIGEVMELLPGLYEKEKDGYLSSTRAKLQVSERFFREEIAGNRDYIKLVASLRNDDLENAKSLAQAKAAIEGQLLNNLSKAWAEYYSSVGGSATLTVSAMEKQIEQLKAAQDSAKLSGDLTSSLALGKQIYGVQQMVKSMEPLKELENIELSIDFTDITANFDAMTKDIGNSASATAKKVNDVLKEAYDEQLKIAKEYYSEQKKQIEAHYKSQAEAIKNTAKAETDALEYRYKREKNEIQSAIDEIDRLIAAKQRAREEEKLDDELAFTKKRVETLETQITYARTPEEAEELKKELARQQEALKDLNVQVEVNALEQQKQAQEQKMADLEDWHKAQLEYIEERRDAELEALEAAQEKTLNDLEVTFNQFSDNLASAYGYVNNETLAIGQRFANATTGALESGFTVVARKAQEQIDSMVAQVEDAIYRLDEAYANILWAHANSMREQGREQERGYSYRSDDHRTMQVTNHITRGLTESQVARMLDRQAERFLYDRR